MACQLCFSTATLPPQWLQLAAAAGAHSSPAVALQQEPACADRLARSGACSTSYSSTEPISRRQPRGRRLPFASLSVQQSQGAERPGLEARLPHHGSIQPGSAVPSSPVPSISGSAAAAPPPQRKAARRGTAAAPAQPAAQAAAPEAAEEARGLAPDVFKAGNVLANGRFKLASKLADGRFTSLWWGQDRDSGQQVVLKLMEAGDFASYSASLKEIAALRAAGADGSPPPPPPPPPPLPLPPQPAAAASTSKRRSRHKAAPPKATPAASATAQPPVSAGMAPEAAGGDGGQHIVQLLDAFEHRSASGRHACMAFTPQGDNMASVLTRYGGGAGIGLAPAAVRAAARQLLGALQHLHSVRGVAHMDLKPDNLLLDRPFVSLHEVSFAEVVGRRLAEVGARLRLCKAPGPLETRPGCYSELDLHKARISLCDFGRAINLRKPLGPSNEDALVIFGKPGARPPEEVLALPYESPAYDMWSLGCVLFTLSTGQDLFSPEPSGELDVNDRHLAAMAGVLGRMPADMVKESPLQTRYFLPDGRLACEMQHVIAREPLPRILAEEHGFSKQEAASFSDFLTPLLEYSPDKRPSAAQQLQHPWLAIEDDDGAAHEPHAQQQANAGSK